MLPEYEVEHFFSCPYCWSEISMLLDLSVTQQAYIEDCEICCNPIRISYRANNNDIVNFSAQPATG